MSSMSTPDPGKESLASMDTMKRREKKNNEHANLRNLAEKFKELNKVCIILDLNLLCFRLGASSLWRICKDYNRRASPC